MPRPVVIGDQCHRSRRLKAADHDLNGPIALIPHIGALGQIACAADDSSESLPRPAITTSGGEWV
jgi:hypothetical protein